VDLIFTLILLLSSLATLGAAAATFGRDSRDVRSSDGTDHRA
jgi:hypothetical protein